MQLHEVALFNLNEIKDDDIEDNDKILIHQALLNREKSDPYAPTLIIWHHFDLIKHKLFKGKHFAFPIFEVNSLTLNEVNHLESMDGIFVTSKWYKDIVNKYCKVPCEVVNLGCSFERDLHPDKIVRNLKDTNFLVAGKWEIRKGQMEIIDCFNKVFYKTSAVKLNLLCHNGFIGAKENKKWEDYAKNSKLGNKINVLPRLKSHKDVRDLMLKNHFGVFTSKAEGWNMELHEMMTLDKPCITTNYSAHTEYCTPKNSYLVEIDSEEPAYDGIFFHGNGSWASLGKSQLDSICDYMKYLHQKRLDDHLFYGINDSVGGLTWKHSASKISQYLTA
jgi:glycosyltransferase involved in cell wall biosynthesis